jgi:hypothetical protein
MEESMTMTFNMYTGVARELEQFRDRMLKSDLSYFFKSYDIAMLEQAITTIKRLMELYLEQKKEETAEKPYDATTYYAGFTAGWNCYREGKSMADVGPLFEGFKKAIASVDAITNLDVARLSPQFQNAKKYVENTGMDVPPEMWDTLAECLVDWPGLMMFDYTDKEHGSYKIQFTRDGFINTFRYTPICRAIDNPPALQMDAEVTFFDPDTGQAFRVPTPELKYSPLEISHTEYHQLHDRISKRDNRIRELEMAIAEHRDAIKSQRLGQVPANQNLWRYVKHVE